MNPLQQLELEEWQEDVEGNQEELKQRFEIDSIDSLNWAFRKLSAFKAKQKEIESFAQAERDRIDQWEESQKKSIRSNAEFFESLILEYHSRRIAEDPKAKTLSTPFGKSKSRSSKAQPDKLNDEDLLQYVKENEMQELIKETVKWGELKKKLKVAGSENNPIVIDENGQVVPGVGVKPATISYSLEVE